MKKRFVVAVVAGGLLAAMLPGVATAQGSSSSDESTSMVPALDYVWNSRLAGDVTRGYVWNSRLAGDVTRDYVWDRRLTSAPAPDYAWDGRLAGDVTPALALAD